MSKEIYFNPQHLAIDLFVQLPETISSTYFLLVFNYILFVET
jgi:hypothetical protein